MHRMVWLSTRLHQPDRQARLQPLAPLPRRFRPRSLKSPRSATPPIPARLGTNTVIGGFHLLIELLVRGDGLVAPAWSNIDHLDWPKELPPTAGVSQSCGGPTSTPLLWQLKKGPSWPRCIGILNGHYSSRALLTATISGSTIACGTGMPRRFVVICSPGSITRTSWRAFSKTTMSRAPHPNFRWPQHAAAAIITFLSPGLRFFHQGQFDGARLRIPTHLCRGPVEPRNPEIAAFYGNLLQVLKNTPALRDGAWSQIQPQ